MFLAAFISSLLVEVSGRAGQEQFRDLVCSFDWDCEKALRVMYCESRGDPVAYSAGNHGLFQIAGIHRLRVGGNLESLFLPEVNVRVAHEIWSEQGWGPWGCRGA